MVNVVAATIAASQGADVEIPQPGSARAEFDAWLASPLDDQTADVRRVTVEQQELEAVLGVGRR